MYVDPYERFVHKPVARKPPPMPIVPRERVAGPKRIEPPRSPDTDIVALIAKYKLIASFGCEDEFGADAHAARTVRSMVAVASATSSVSIHEILSKRKTSGSAKARQIATWLALRFTPSGLSAVGRFLGGRDHTSILYNQRRVDFAIGDLGLSGLYPNTPERWAWVLWTTEWPVLARRDRPHARKVAA